MNVESFLKTIYLGDRGCKSILIDCWNKVVKLQVDCISRVRAETWNYYDAEDVEDGWIVFEGVQSCSFDPSGPLPNDFFERIEFEPLGEERSQGRFLIEVGSISGTNAHNITGCLVKITIVANSVHLEDPLRPGLRIVE